MTTVINCLSLNNGILNANMTLFVMTSWHKPCHVYHRLCFLQVVMTKTLTVMMYWFMSTCHNKDISNNVIFALKMSAKSCRKHA